VKRRAPHRIGAGVLPSLHRFFLLQQ